MRKKLWKIFFRDAHTFTPKLKEEYRVNTSKPYMGRGENFDAKFNICSNFLLCSYVGCPHIMKHKTLYYYNGNEWTNCRTLSCNKRYSNGNQSSNHCCIEVKDGE